MKLHERLGMHSPVVKDSSNPSEITAESLSNRRCRLGVLDTMMSVCQDSVLVPQNDATLGDASSGPSYTCK